MISSDWLAHALPGLACDDLIIASHPNSFWSAGDGRDSARGGCPG